MKKSELLHKLEEIFIDHEQKEHNFVDYKNEEALKDILDLEKNIELNNLDETLLYLKKYLQYSVQTWHPQFVNRMWTDANMPSIMWDIMVALTNTSSCTFESAPVSTLMEKYMIDEIAKVVGFTSYEGQMTTGSSNSNMIAMLAARNSYSKEAKQQWLFWENNLIAFVNEESHYSLDKAANIIWIGTENLYKISAQKDGSMNLLQLEEKIIEANKIWKVFFVVATAGTTVRGWYDNIAWILKLKEKYDFWLHVDGAWWWPVIFSDTLKAKYMKSIEEVDSFTFDFHKMPWTALMCNMFLINKRKWVLGHTCSAGNTDYIFHEDVSDLWVNSLQCWKRVDSLKLFLDWKYYGKEWFWTRIEKYYSLCEYAEKVISENDKLELSFERSSFNICFIYKTDSREEQNTLNKTIRDRLYKEELSLVWSSTINWKFFLRLLIANQKIIRKDIDQFFDNVIQVWNTLHN